MQGVKMRWAYLREADLRNVNLQKEEDHETDLQDSNLQMALLEDVKLQDVNLKGSCPILVIDELIGMAMFQYCAQRVSRKSPSIY